MWLKSSLQSSYLWTAWGIYLFWGEKEFNKVNAVDKYNLIDDNTYNSSIVKKK